MRVLVRSICALSFLLFPLVVGAAKAEDDCQRAGAQGVAQADDWCTYRHDSQRTGTQPVQSDLSDPAKVSGLHVVGQYPPDGSVPIPFAASPIVVKGTVFIGDVNGVFYALDATSGALKWRYPKPGTALAGSCLGGENYSFGQYGIRTGATYAVIGGQEAVIFGAPDPTADKGFGSARLFAFSLTTDPNNPQPIWTSKVVAHVDGCKPCAQGDLTCPGYNGERHERIAYASPLVLGNKVYVGIHDAGDSPIQQGRVVAVDLTTNPGQIVDGFKFFGTGAAYGAEATGAPRGGGVWNAIATDGTSLYFTTGNVHDPWCRYPYWGAACPAATEPTPNYGLGMVSVDKDTGHPNWIYQTVPFELDGDPDWAAGVTVMPDATCGPLVASVQKDGWAYALAASGPPLPRPPEPHPQCSATPPPPVAEPGLNAPSWQFPPTTNGGWFTDCDQHHGDDDYRRPGAAWGDVFIVRTGGENNTNIGNCQCELGDPTCSPGNIACRGYNELHALNACATADQNRTIEQNRVRWIANIPSLTSDDGHISYSSPTVTGGIVFIGTYQNPTDHAGHLIVLADPTVAPGAVSQQVCSNPDLAVAATACTAPYAPVPSLQPIADLPMLDGGSLASMRNEPVLAEGRVYVATTPNFNPKTTKTGNPDAGHVYILAPGCSCDFPLNASINQLYLGPNGCPIQVAQSGASQGLLVMSGPWVASDHGVNANGEVTDRGNLPNGSTINLTPGFADLGPGAVPRSDALMGINVSVPASAPVGPYCVDVQATDPATHVSAFGSVPIQIYNCNPLTACPPGACGTFPTGCGGNLECGLCQAAEVCIGGGCCNPSTSVCGKRCPPLEVFCPKTAKCVREGLCPGMNCRVVNGITECQ